MRLFRRRSRLAALEERIRVLEDQRYAYERIIAIMTSGTPETDRECRHRHLRLISNTSPHG